MKRLFMIAALGLAGCAQYDKSVKVVNSPSEIPAIHQIYSDKLSKLRVGMPLDAFQGIVPEAYVAGQSGLTTAYALDHTTQYYRQASIDWAETWSQKIAPEVNKQSLWFYFYNDRLASWGRPHDWPERPDLIIEKRVEVR